MKGRGDSRNEIHGERWNRRGKKWEGRMKKGKKEGEGRCQGRRKAKRASRQSKREYIIPHATKAARINVTKDIAQTYRQKSLPDGSSFVDAVGYFLLALGVFVRMITRSEPVSHAER